MMYAGHRATLFRAGLRSSHTMVGRAHHIVKASSTGTQGHRTSQTHCRRREGGACAWEGRETQMWGGKCCEQSAVHLKHEWLRSAAYHKPEVELLASSSQQAAYIAGLTLAALNPTKPDPPQPNHPSPPQPTRRPCCCRARPTAAAHCSRPSVSPHMTGCQRRAALPCKTLRAQRSLQQQGGMASGEVFAWRVHGVCTTCAACVR